MLPGISGERDLIGSRRWPQMWQSAIVKRAATRATWPIFLLSVDQLPPMLLFTAICSVRVVEDWLNLLDQIRRAELMLEDTPRAWRR
jgi:hypothetical protein